MPAGSMIACQWFFDGENVVRHVDKATRRVLSRFGAMVRRTARRSIRKPRLKPIAQLTDSERALKRAKEAAGQKYTRPRMSAKPGEPPRDQTKTLKRGILFWYNAAGRFVDIGPAPFKGGQGARNMDALEDGGRVQPAEGKAFDMTAHPFMRPALGTELPRLEALWKGAVT